MSRSWVVLKFGGTSVSTAARWKTIAGRVAELRERHKVLVVVSALAQVSNRLEAAVEEALGGADERALPWIVEAHRRLIADLGLSEPVESEVLALFEETGQRLRGIRLTEEAPPRLRARIMATGEMASSRLGAAALASQGIDAALLDARDLLTAEARPGDPEEKRFLEAQVSVASSPERLEDQVGGRDVAITQGFIARTPQGETCLLGRGGSDTSAALLAVLAGAEWLEIWTDVHGLFTADPRRVPSARLIKRIGYREAQELAAMGARVLHPRCLGPVSTAGIPLTVKCTDDPGGESTHVLADGDDQPAVHAVTCRTGIALLTIETLAMWEAPGFLARVFAPFEQFGISVDLVATSESAVTVTLDRIPGGIEGSPFAALVARLESLGRVKVVHPTAVLSIVGRRIRTVLHELGPALAAFRDRPVHLVSQSSEDLNISFVVAEEDAPRLTEMVHAALFSAQGAEGRFGPTWERMNGTPKSGEAPHRWWANRRSDLLALARDGQPRYIYDLATVRARAESLRSALSAVDDFYFSMKANWAPEVLEAVAELGFGIECVSLMEVERARQLLGPRAPILFTPSFCPLEEYGAAFEAGAEVTIDSVGPLATAPELFRGRPIALRIDPGQGRGHHEKVRTAGPHSKFGLRVDEVDVVSETVKRLGMNVDGLHAHVGSGILEADTWPAVGRVLVSLAERFPALRWIDIGGGLGVVERPGQPPLDLAVVNQGLARIRQGLGAIRWRLEPGRYLVSDAGVLLSKVTQVRRKGGVNFAGVATGMNSLIRPALYGAWHAIYNLSRLEQPADVYYHVVGPICESGDVLGRDRLLPRTEPGDILLIENAGAYGAVMASRYNLREPATEVVLR